ncbi:hypothetical protein GCM10027190_58470 [Spirosoma areae]
MAACHQPEDKGVTIRWNGQRATGLSIPRLPISGDSLGQLLAVRLSGNETAILGNYQQIGDEIIFEPIVPFTRGLRYSIWLRAKRLQELTIPALAADNHPALLAIYPSQDSLPDNLLKIYLHFSRSMREGQSKKYVALIKNRTDTLPGVFLDLQPELWNADRTMLTLWLDPGRIKRDLRPNKQLGAPLKAGVQYQLVISATWPDEQGASLGTAITKSFVAVERDSLSPVPARWSIYEPKLGSQQPLDVAFGEALDYSLLTETLHILDEDGSAVLGKWQLIDEEKRGWFKPDAVWRSGQYRLQVEGRLEDLAGNNLNRPFDRDVTDKNSTLTAKPVTSRFFRVK